ncbi:MAG: phosphoglycerate kinase [Alphaproteobacteria bacterium]|nr:phosphoglycerate kinase [Alphaproteobacteria bacterium]
MADYKTIDGLDVAGKRVLIRVDLNVPVQDGRVTDTTRIERVAPTIAELAERGAKVVVLSHFGRPKGQRVPAMSLKPLVASLSAALKGRTVIFADDCVGPEAEHAIAALKAGDIALLENVRYHAGEEKNDPALAKQLAALGDLYVNDAFSAAHRAHASTAGIARFLPSYAGRLMQAELDALHQALGKPAHPVTAIVGGAKVSTKLQLLGNLIGKVDTLVVGGGMANTFLNAKGIEVGRSLCEREMVDIACTILERAKHERCRIVLPSDAVIAREFKAGAATETVAANAVPPDAMILDIGPKTVAEIVSVIEQSRTLVWNGPLGAFEIAPFDLGTVMAARAAAERTAAGKLLSVAGGGDTVAALIQAGVAERFSYVSTAGGAFLEWLEGKTLPGVAALGP